jgi:hypothetical protein
MKNYLLNIIVCSCLFTMNHLSHKDLDSWNVLQGEDYKIWVGWLEAPDIDWCRTISTLPYSIDKISRMIEDLENYYQVFDRVKSSDVITGDIVHIRIDMPFPISDRDYIVRYEIEKNDNYMSYKFGAVKDTAIPLNDDSIRLANAAGEWYLKWIDDSSTEVTYTWNGELAGDFPNWALTKAWTKQGNEMLEWLAESLEELYKE